jgi:hypothetical protein
MITAISTNWRSLLGVEFAFRNYRLKSDDTTVIIVMLVIKPKAKLTSDCVA